MEQNSEQIPATITSAWGKRLLFMALWKAKRMGASWIIREDYVLQGRRHDRKGIIARFHY